MAEPIKAPNGAAGSAEDDSTVEALETVMFRFATTDAAGFPAAVARVLPKLLSMLPGASARVRGKVLEVLQHINSRMGPEGKGAIDLPVRKVVDLFRSTQDSFARTFSLVYIAKGFPRVPLADRPALLFDIVRGVSNVHSSSLRRQILHIFAAALPGFSFDPENAAASALSLAFLSTPPASTETSATAMQLSPADRTNVVGYLTDVLLFTEGFVGKSQGKPCPGLSQDVYKHIESLLQTVPVYGCQGESATATLASLQLAVVSLAGSGLLPPSDALPLLLVGSVRGGGIRAASERGLKRITPVSLDAKGSASALFRLFLGDPVPKSPKTRQTGKKKADKAANAGLRAPAHVPLRAALLRHLSGSVDGANQVAKSVQVVFQSLYSPQTNDRLRLQGARYASWLVGAMPPAKLKKAAPVLFQGLLRLLQARRAQATKGAAAKIKKPRKGGRGDSDHVQSATRERFPPLLVAAVYGAIGRLARAHPPLVARSIAAFTLFFRALGSEADASSAQAAHEGYLNVLRAVSAARAEKLKNEIGKLLLAIAVRGGDVGPQGASATSSRDTAAARRRLALVQAANMLFAFSDVRARYVCLLMSADASLKVRNEAARGLVPPQASHSPEETVVESGDSKAGPAGPDKGVLVMPASKRRRVVAGAKNPQTKTTWPSFPKMTAYVSARVGAKSAEVSEKVLSAAIRFLRECAVASASRADGGGTPRAYAATLLKDQSPGESRDSNALFQFQSLVERALCSRDSAVAEEAAQALASLVRWAPAAFAGVYAARRAWLEEQLLSKSAPVRLSTAALLATLSSHITEDNLDAMLQSLVDNGLAPAARAAGDQAAALASGLPRIHGSLLGAAVLAAEALVRARAADAQPGALLVKACQCVAELLSHPAPEIISAACVAIRCIGARAPLPLPLGPLQDPTDAKKGSTPPAADVDESTPSIGSLLRTLLKLARRGAGQGARGAARIPEEAVRAVGSLARGAKHARLSKRALEGLYALRNVSHEEVHFAVGRALVDVGRGGDSIGDSDMAEGSSGLGAILDQILDKYANQGSAVNRMAACAWLLCLVKYGGTAGADGESDDSSINDPSAWILEAAAGPAAARATTGDSKTGEGTAATRGRTALSARAEAIQKSFTVSLTESRQITQEMAAKGLATLYSVGDAGTKSGLVDALTRAFREGTRRVTSDTKVAVSGGATGTRMASYGELCEMAREVGQPDLAYTFLDLAGHHSIWNSKAGAAFSLGSILRASERLRPSLEALIPKLFRYRHDPDEAVRRSMQRLWTSLVPGGRLAERHFEPVLAELLKSMGRTEWRARESAASATASLIQGARAGPMTPRLASLWSALFRLLDDPKDSVRAGAFGLARSMTALSERLVDPVYTRSSDAKACLAELVPVLAGPDGITSRVSEVQGVCLGALLRVVKAARVLLEPHLGTLVRALLSALSSLEPQAFSYMQFHAQSVDLTPEQLESMRVRAAAATPVQDALDACLDAMRASAVAPVCATIVALVDQGVGLPTLAACARLATRLLVRARLGDAPLRAALAQCVGDLIRSFVRGMRDRSGTVRKEYARAVGALVALAKPKRVGKVVAKLIEMYTGAEVKPLAESSGPTDDVMTVTFPDRYTESSVARRLTAGLTAKHMSAKSQPQLMRFAKEILPVAFVASMDPDKDTAAAWSACWTECARSNADGVSLYAPEIVTLALQMSKSPSYFLKKSAARALEAAVRVAGGSSGMTPRIGRVTEFALGALSPGRYWDGKEVIFKLATALAEAAKGSMDKERKQQVLGAVIAAAAAPGRGGRAYRVAGLECAAAISKACPAIDVFSEAKKVLLDPLLSRGLQSSAGSATNTDSKDGDKSNETAAAPTRTKDKIGPLVLASALKSTGALWPKTQSLPQSYRSQVEGAQWAIAAASSAMSGHPWNVRTSALGVLEQVLSSVYLGGEGAPRPSALAATDAESAAKSVRIGLQDIKYASVRRAALAALIAMGGRGKAMAVLVPGDAWESLVAEATQLLSDADPGVASLAEKAIQASGAALDAVLNEADDGKQQGADEKEGQKGDMYL